MPRASRVTGTGSASPSSGSTRAHFDSLGTFLGRVGAPGDGPGELRSVRDVQWLHDEILVLDAIGPRLTTFAPNGDLLRTTRLAAPSGPFVVAGDSTVVVAAMGQAREQAGVPLHELSMRSGEPARHFGAPDRPAYAGDPSPGSVGPGQSARPGRLWFSARDGQGRPFFRAVDLRTGRVTGPDFRAPEHMGVEPSPGGERRIEVEARGRYFESIVEVYDLGSGDRLAGRTFDRGAGITLVAGVVVIHSVEDGPEGGPRLVLHRVRLVPGG